MKLKKKREEKFTCRKKYILKRTSTIFIKKPIRKITV